MNRRKNVLLVALAVIAVALVAAPVALGAAGGGSSGFSGGGGGGGGGGGFHGSGKGFAIYLIFRALFDIALIGHGLGLLVLVAIALLAWFYIKGMPKIAAWFTARRDRGRARTRTTTRRSRRVEAAAAEAASDDDPLFAPDIVRPAAANLFTQIQAAWSRDDRIALRGLVAPSLLAEWERRLDDLRSKGWTNHIEVLDPPVIQYVALNNRGDDGENSVTVRIDARLRDYVVDRTGRHIKRSGQFREIVENREYWTLQRRNDHWILASIEQGAEGSHALTDTIIATEAHDDERLKDAALIEGAVAEAVPEGVGIAEVADLQYDGDARAAANDLSVADGRFAPYVLEVAARRAVAAWAQAVDGAQPPQRAIADASAVRELLHPGDPSGRTRLVVRGPVVRQIRINSLDAGAEPPTMTIDLDLAGRRYIQDRDTAAVVSGSQSKLVNFSERWTLSLSGNNAQPWRVVRVETPVGA
jgi:predicted lipid-binding transport protein (Tim44 family)